MIRIAISQAAFEAIARTLPLGSMSFENAIDEDGNRLIWLEPRVVDRLRSLRGPGESYSDVILAVGGDGAGTMRSRVNVFPALKGEDFCNQRRTFPPDT